LVTVRVSQINWCRFCIDINSAVLAKRSGSQEKVEALDNWKESHLYDEKERIALEYAEAITYLDQNVNDELMERLLSFFDKDSVVELTGLIAFQNMSSKFNSALDVLPQGFCNISNSMKTLNVKSGILHFSVNTFCNYRFAKARKAKPYPWINESEKISVHCTLKVCIHVISKFSSRFPIST